MKYRSRSEIIALILETAARTNEGATKTKVMYTAFLSHTQLERYLTIALEGGLIEFQEATKTYRTTEKGLHFLQISNQLDGMISKRDGANRTM